MKLVGKRLPGIIRQSLNGWLPEAYQFPLPPKKQRDEPISQSISSKTRSSPYRHPERRISKIPSEDPREPNFIAKKFIDLLGHLIDMINTPIRKFLDGQFKALEKKLMEQIEFIAKREIAERTFQLYKPNYPSS